MWVLSRLVIGTTTHDGGSEMRVDPSDTIVIEDLKCLGLVVRSWR